MQRIERVQKTVKSYHMINIKILEKYFLCFCYFYYIDLSLHIITIMMLYHIFPNIVVNYYY